jgi:hypothetical protein
MVSFAVQLVSIDHILTVNLSKPFMIFCIMLEFSGEEFLILCPILKLEGGILSAVCNGLLKTCMTTLCSGSLFPPLDTRECNMQL